MKSLSGHAAPGSLPLSTVRQQVLTDAQEQELQVAAGRDTRISRVNQELLPYDLREAADEVRQAQPGKHVTISEVLDVYAGKFDAAVAPHNQVDPANLSPDEVRQIFQSNYTLGERVQSAIDILTAPALPPAVKLPGAEVKAKLDGLLQGFLFDGHLGSEGGEGVTAVHVTTPLPQPPTANELAIALGHDPSTPQGYVEVYNQPSYSFLKEFYDAQMVDRATVDEVSALLRGLTNLRVMVIGDSGASGVDPNHPTYIVGTAQDGTTVGLKTGVIWT